MNLHFKQLAMLMTAGYNVFGDVVDFYLQCSVGADGIKCSEQCSDKNAEIGYVKNNVFKPLWTDVDAEIVNDVSLSVAVKQVAGTAAEQQCQTGLANRMPATAET